MRREVEVDTALAELWEEAEKARGYIESARLSLARAVGIRPVYETKHRLTVRESTPELIELAMAKVESGVMGARKAGEALDSMTKYKAMLAAARVKAEPLEAEYDAAPWSRFFLVNNHGGHIHSTMSCSTCRFDTSFFWLPELSGLTEKDAVEAHGAILCTVCFPSAPVEWTGGESKAASAEKAERAAAKAERDAAKAAKAITSPDGSKLRGKWGTIATLVTANRELVDSLAWIVEWESEMTDHPNFESVTGEYREVAARIAEAIAHKTGVTVEAVMAVAGAKAAAKYKRERGS